MKFLPTAYFSHKYVKYLAMNIDTAKTKAMHSKHGLRTLNKGINQKYLKNWADVADKIMLLPYLKIWNWD